MSISFIIAVGVPLPFPRERTTTSHATSVNDWRGGKFSLTPPCKKTTLPTFKQRTARLNTTMLFGRTPVLRPLARLGLALSLSLVAIVSGDAQTPAPSSQATTAESE